MLGEGGKELGDLKAASIISFHDTTRIHRFLYGDRLCKTSEGRTPCASHGSHHKKKLLDDLGLCW